MGGGKMSADDDVIINQSGGAWCMAAVKGAEQNGGRRPRGGECVHVRLENGGRGYSSK